MPSLKKNVILGTASVNNLKSKTTCSNDIIPKTELPFLDPRKFAQYELEFGRVRFQKYLQYTTDARNIRQSLIRKIEENRLKFPLSPIFTRSLACIQLGIGECQELSTAIVSDLIEQKCSDVSLLLIEGGVTKKIDNVTVPYLHGIVLLGEINLKNLVDLGSFKKQPKNLVVIDPLLGYVGPANNYVSDNQSYLEIYKFNKIHQTVSFNSSLHSELNKIKRQATKLVQMLKKEGIQSFEMTDLGVEKSEDKAYLFDLLSHNKYSQLFSLDSKGNTLIKDLSDPSSKFKNKAETIRFFNKPLNEELIAILPKYNCSLRKT